MKFTISTSIFLFILMGLNAQVTLDKKYDFSASVIKLETQGYKYYLMDVPNAQCRIYNTDHSLFKTINCSVPNNFYLADIKFISENLFDDDAGIELMYSYYKYIPINDTYYYEYNSKIINDNGSEILHVEGARYNYILQIEESTFKLFSYCFDYSDVPEKVWTNIYNLPDSPVSSYFLDEKGPEVWLNAFPNPATETVKVAYTLPENITEGKLHLFDNNGRLVNHFLIDNHTNHLALDIAQLNSGIYHYFIEYGNTKTASKKLLVH